MRGGRPYGRFEVVQSSKHGSVPLAKSPNRTAQLEGPRRRQKLLKRNFYVQGRRSLPSASTSAHDALN
jgi:hypothetical protein